MEKLTQGTKDIWGLSLASLLILTGIVLAFISFFMLSLIHSSILFYIGIGVSFFGAIIGIDIKFNNLEGEFKAKMENIEQHIEIEVNKRLKNETEA